MSLRRSVSSLSELLRGAAAAGHVPLYSPNGWESLPGPEYDLRSYGTVAIGGDHTAVVQAAIAAIVAAGGKGQIRRPRGIPLNLSDTITIAPTLSTAYVNISFVGGGDVRNVVWTGGSSKAVFRTKNWKYGAIQGIDIDIPGTVNDVVGWELYSDANYQSNTRLSFRDSGVRIASGAKGCGGYLAMSNGGAGDFASLSWDSCDVVGGGTYNQDGNFGWKSRAANALVWNWRNCIGAGLAMVGNNQAIITRLNGAITNTDSTITVDNAGYYPYAGKLTIETERVSYTSRNATQFLGCTRGVDATVAAAHADNITATEYHTGSSTPGGSWTFSGLNADTVGTVLHVSKGPVALYGGRSESIDRLLMAGFGGGSTGMRYLLSGHLVASSTPPTEVLIGMNNAGHLRIESCEFAGHDYTAAMITATGVDTFGTAGANGSLTIQDTAIQGASGNVFWTLPATWKANVRNTSRVTSSLTPQARCDTRTSGAGTILSGTTSLAVTHGLPTTPTLAGITVTLGENPMNDVGLVWVSGITSTQFTVNCRSDPGASNLDFSWTASVE